MGCSIDKPSFHTPSPVSPCPLMVLFDYRKSPSGTSQVRDKPQCDLRQRSPLVATSVITHPSQPGLYLDWVVLTVQSYYKQH